MVRLVKRRKLHIMLMACMLILTAFLMGCGGNKASDSGNTNDAPPKAVEPANNSDANANDDGDDDVVVSEIDKESISGDLKVLTPWGGGFLEQFDNMFADFNKEYPNVTVTLMEQTTADLAALLAAGEIPDIISSNGTSPDLRQDDMIEDLTPYIKTDPLVKPSVYHEPAYTRSITPDGKIWALPWHVDPNFAVAYNIDVLEQYGYTEIPEMNSLSELGDFLHKFWIVENGEQVMTTFEPNNVYGPFNSLITFSFLNGASADTFYDEASNTVAFSDPKIVQALEWIMQFKREHIDPERLSKMDQSLPEGTGRFQAGKSLMEPHVTPTLRSHYELNPDLGFAPMPANSIWIGGWSFSLMTPGVQENKEAAWELLKWMTSTKEGAQSQQEHFGWISGIADNPHLEEMAKTDPVTAAAYDVLMRAKNLPPQIPVDFQPEFNEKWNEVMEGTLEPKAFLDHMTQYINTVLAEQND